MASREGPAERGRRRGAKLRSELGDELRRARQQHCLSQEEVGTPAGLSPAMVSRIERGLVHRLDVEVVAVLLATVGLELSMRAYPAGDPVRDAAHLALLDRLRVIVHRSMPWRFEVPLPIPGDLRAWDATLLVEQRRVGVEAETRPNDLQELERRLALKMRDGGVDTSVLLLSNTRHNRRLVRAHAGPLASAFPVPGARARELLRAGVHPGGSSIMLH